MIPKIIIRQMLPASYFSSSIKTLHVFEKKIKMLLNIFSYVENFTDTLLHRREWFVVVSFWLAR
jgi:hypothetical protein